MAADTYINANDFMAMLKANNLLIVSATEFEANAAMKRQRLMRRKAISLKEIVDANFFPIKVTKTLIDWIENGKIKPTEYFKESTGKNRIFILTSTIKRLGYAE
jgi:hypothetical protein